jgi:hypothetical protein
LFCAVPVERTVPSSVLWGPFVQVCVTKQNKESVSSIQSTFLVKPGITTCLHGSSKLDGRGHERQVGSVQRSFDQLLRIGACILTIQECTCQSCLLLSHRTLPEWLQTAVDPSRGSRQSTESSSAGKLPRESCHSATALFASTT